MPRNATAPVVQPLSEPQRRELMEKLGGAIAPPPLSLAYQFGVVLVSAGMIALPVIYVLLIVLAALGVCWYTVHAAPMLGMVRGGRAIVFAFLLFLVPIFAGGMLVLFMLKPLFARATPRQTPLTLQRQHEPLLFEFVDRIARLVGAPCPRTICVDAQVNASASFRRGMLSFLGNDLTLTIGLPLLASLNLTQFAGVLAHEFGHFSQGLGMRLTYVIRHISFWFTRLVYERDSWDDWVQDLRRSDSHWVVTLAALLSLLMIWLSRRVLWVLMWMGHFLSSFLLRQMEYDADRREIAVAGTRDFTATFGRIALTEASLGAAQGNLQRAWDERRLCDDLCALVASFEERMPGEIRSQILSSMQKGKTGLLDTHPSPRDRVAAAKRINASGFFSDERPSAVLLSNFPAACRMITLDFYHHVLGDAYRSAELVPAQRYIGNADAQVHHHEALDRLFMGALTPSRPLFPSTWPAISPAAAAEALLELRTRQCDTAPELAVTIKRYLEQDEKAVTLAIGGLTREAGLSIGRADAAKMGVTAPAEITRNRQIARRERDETGRSLAALQQPALERMAIAMALREAEQRAAAPDEELAPEAPAGSIQRMTEALAAIRLASADVEQLRERYCTVRALCERARHNGNSETFGRVLWAESEHLVKLLASIRDSLATGRYPYDHNRTGELRIGAFLIEHIPPAEQIGEVVQVASAVLDGVYTLYRRIMADLAAITEEVEKSLGLEPLPVPDAAAAEVAATA